MKYVLVILNLICFLSSNGQRNDNIWPLSNYSFFGPIGPYYLLDFTSGQPDTVVYQRKITFLITNASISDSSGNQLYSTNGQWIANKINDTLLNSQNFNPGWGTNYYNHGLGFSQASIFLPFGDSLFYVIHNSADTFLNVDGQFDVQPFNLRYTAISRSLDGGNGGVIQGIKNVVTINDTLLLGRISAVKHANGRDWWVLVHKYYSDIYYKILFTPNGFMGPFIQQIGPVIKPKDASGADCDILGMANFSPVGSKYVNIDFDTLHLYDFDRCSGLLSNYRQIFPQVSDSMQLVGCSFSSSGQFLYSNSFKEAFQSDLSIPNNIQTLLIASYDGFTNPISTEFFINQLGPDGKIYLSTYGGTRSLHVIDQPDTLGILCNFLQHNLDLPQNIGGNHSLPNFPNYRLGRLLGSACDTLTNLTPSPSPQDRRVGVVPNPNQGNFIVSYTLPQNKAGLLQVLDVMGKQVYRQTLPQWSTMQRLDLPQIAKGIYVLKVICDGNSTAVRFVRE